MLNLKKNDDEFKCSHVYYLKGLYSYNFKLSPFIDSQPYPVNIDSQPYPVNIDSQPYSVNIDSACL